MMRELERMTAIPNHRNVISIHEARIINGIPHIIMEYAEGVNEDGKFYGSSLDDLFSNNYKFCFEDVLWIALSVCRGLSHCQQHIDGFVHGDIKPANILFQPLDSNSFFDDGMGKYQVMIADFGGGKTPGFYVSERTAASTKEDDIYAFAKTMELLFKAACQNGGVSSDNLYYWNQFYRGLSGLLYEESSSILRKNIDFLSLYHGYAEAFEIVLDLNINGYRTEDVIQQENSGIRSKLVKRINDICTKISMGGKTEEAEHNLLELLDSPGVETVYFDDLPALLLIQLRLADIYFDRKQWKEFDLLLKIMKDCSDKLNHPLKYKGRLNYSSDIRTDIEILEQLAHMEKGEKADIELLICAVRLDVDCEFWLEKMFIYILENNKEKLSKLEKQILSLEEPISTESSQLIRYHYILGSYHMFRADYLKACQHYGFLAEQNPDRLEYLYKYAALLCSTGSIMLSMMYFERIYDIYEMEGSFLNKDWNTVKMALVSLLFMCDYQCFNGHCQAILMMKNIMLTPLDNEWISNMSEMADECQVLLNNWRRLEHEVLYGENKFHNIEKIKQMKENAKSVLANGDIDALSILHRLVAQVYFESSRAMARIYIDAGRHNAAIQECNDILLIDHTNFDGYRIRGECFIKLWNKTKQENYRMAADKDLHDALKYVYAMYPGKNGRKSLEAEHWEKEVHKKLKELDDFF